jgi:hypothetical protein
MYPISPEAVTYNLAATAVLFEPVLTEGIFLVVCLNIENVPVPIVTDTKYIYRVQQCLSPRRNRDSLFHPLSRQRVCPSPPPPGRKGGGGNSPAGEGVGGVPIPTAGEKT